MTQWIQLDLDPAVAAKVSLPAWVPMPADESLPEDGQVPVALAAGWAERFLAEHPEDEHAESLRRLVAKAPIWDQVGPLLFAESWAEMLPLLEQILAIDLDDIAARFNRSSAHRGLGNLDAALADLAAIETGFGDEGVYHANVGRTYEVRGDRDAAIAAYRKALELLDGDAFLLDRLTALGVLVSAVDENGQAIYVDAEVFADGVRQDLANNAGDADYLTSVSQLLLEGGHWDLARNAAELALSNDAGRADAMLFAGVAQARLGRMPQALAQLDAHVALEPTSAMGHGNRAHVLHALGRRADAVAAAERTLELNRNDLGAVQVLVAGEDGPAGALERTDALAASQPDSWAVVRVAGDLAMATGDADRAIRHWVEATGRGADDSTVGMLLGELGRLGRIEELCEIADGITRLSDRDPGLRWNVAAGYSEGGRDAEARIVFASIAHDEDAPPDLRAASQARL